MAAERKVSIDVEIRTSVIAAGLKAARAEVQGLLSDMEKLNSWSMTWKSLKLRPIETSQAEATVKAFEQTNTKLEAAVKKHADLLVQVSATPKGTPAPVKLVMQERAAARAVESLRSAAQVQQKSVGPKFQSKEDIDGGWKLHLATDKPEDVSKILKELGIAHKVGHTGDQEGKDLTAYLGHKDAADEAARLIEAKAGHLLKTPHGETLKDDIPFNAKVMGRFDAPRRDFGRGGFHQYGGKGFPWLWDDMDPLNKRPGADERAQAELKRRYGEFYTGAPPPEKTGFQDHEGTAAVAGAAVVAPTAPKQQENRAEAAAAAGGAIIGAGLEYFLTKTPAPETQAHGIGKTYLPSTPNVQQSMVGTPQPGEGTIIEALPNLVKDRNRILYEKASENLRSKLPGMVGNEQQMTAEYLAAVEPFLAEQSTKKKTMLAPRRSLPPMTPASDTQMSYRPGYHLFPPDTQIQKSGTQLDIEAHNRKTVLPPSKPPGSSVATSPGGEEIPPQGVVSRQADISVTSAEAKILRDFEIPLKDWAKHLEAPGIAGEGLADYLRRLKAGIGGPTTVGPFGTPASQRSPAPLSQAFPGMTQPLPGMASLWDAADPFSTFGVGGSAFGIGRAGISVPPANVPPSYTGGVPYGGTSPYQPAQQKDINLFELERRTGDLPQRRLQAPAALGQQIVDTQRERQYAESDFGSRDLGERINLTRMLVTEEAKLQMGRLATMRDSFHDEEYNAMLRSRLGLRSAEARTLRERTVVDRGQIGSAAHIGVMREEMLLRKDMARNDRMERRVGLTVEYGRLGAELTLLSENLQAVGRTAGWAFGIGTAGIAGMVRAGSPVTWNTLTGSFRLLAGEIGQTVMPQMLALAGGIQNAYRWFRDLDQSTRGAIGTVLVWGTVAAGGIWLVVKGITALAAAYRAAAVAATWLNTSQGLSGATFGLLGNAGMGAMMARGGAGAGLVPQIAGGAAGQVAGSAAGAGLAAGGMGLAAKAGIAGLAIAGAVSLYQTVAEQFNMDANASIGQRIGALGARTPIGANIRFVSALTSGEGIGVALKRYAYGMTGGLAFPNAGAPPGTPGAAAGAAASPSERLNQLMLGMDFRPFQTEVESLHDYIQNQSIRGPLQQETFQQEMRELRTLLELLGDRFVNALPTVPPGAT